MGIAAVGLVAAWAFSGGRDRPAPVPVPGPGPGPGEAPAGPWGRDPEAWLAAAASELERLRTIHLQPVLWRSFLQDSSTMDSFYRWLAAPGVEGLHASPQVVERLVGFDARARERGAPRPFFPYLSLRRPAGPGTWTAYAEEIFRDARVELPAPRPPPWLGLALEKFEAARPFHEAAVDRAHAASSAVQNLQFEGTREGSSKLAFFLIMKDPDTAIPELLRMREGVELLHEGIVALARSLVEEPEMREAVPILGRRYFHRIHYLFCSHLAAVEPERLAGFLPDHPAADYLGFALANQAWTMNRELGLESGWSEAEFWKRAVGASSPGPVDSPLARMRLAYAATVVAKELRKVPRYDPARFRELDRRAGKVLLQTPPHQTWLYFAFLAEEALRPGNQVGLGRDELIDALDRSQAGRAGVVSEDTTFAQGVEARGRAALAQGYPAGLPTGDQRVR